MIKQNIGTIDRIIRVLVGVILLSLTQVLEGDIRWIGLIGIVPLLTAAMGFCPLYCPLQMNTGGCCRGETTTADSCCADVTTKTDSCCSGGACGISDKKD